MKIKNWDRHQHYKLKNPKGNKKMHWFKLYGGDLLNDVDYAELSDSHKLALFEFWCLASQHGGELPEIKVISFRLRRSVEEIENSLRSLGNWIILDKVYTSSRVEEKRGEEKRGEERREDEHFATFTF
tara:strand:+ start:348 stop:731 length:384 start_codon:yes stop_codon:yes gene_type:complete